MQKESRSVSVNNMSGGKPITVRQEGPLGRDTQQAAKQECADCRNNVSSKGIDSAKNTASAAEAELSIPPGKEEAVRNATEEQKRTCSILPIPGSDETPRPPPGAQTVMSAETQERYLLKSMLGSGSYGDVVSATRFRDGKDFALKCSVGLSVKTAKMEQFALEVFRQAGGCRFVVGLEDSGTLDHHFIPGKASPSQDLCLVLSLADCDLSCFREKHNLPSAVRLEFCRQLAEGLSFCFQQGFAHCDIRLDNILVSIAEGAVKLTDFGLAVCFLSEPPVTKRSSANSRVSWPRDFRVAMGSKDKVTRKDLDHLASTMIFLWHDSDVIFTGDTAEAFQRRKEELGAPRGNAFGFAGFAIGSDIFVDKRFRVYRQEMKKLRRQNKKTELDLRKPFREFLMWYTTQANTTEGNGFGIAIPEDLVDHCFMLCYQFEKDVPLSVSALAESLNRIVPTKVRQQSRKYFQDLVSSKSKQQ